MAFFRKVFGKESLDERVNHLWESAIKLSWSDTYQEKAVLIYTELLSLVDETSTSFNICAILRNRAISYRSLKHYDEALQDLARELEIAQMRGDRMRVMESQKIAEETREWKRKHDIDASGGEKAEKFLAMNEQGRKLWGTEPEADVAFETLFADLMDDDPDVRAEAARLLADARNALQRLISIYQECLYFDPRRASLAGRVLGRKIAKGSDDMIHAQIAQIMYGIDVSFIPCSCVHCGHLNKGIAAPPNGPMVPYYHQEDDEGAYAVPVLCDRCGKEFFVVWDMNPQGAARFPFPGIGIVFAIEGLDSHKTSDRAWQLFMKHLDPKRLGKCILVGGDTAATLNSKANEFCIGIYGPALDPNYIRETFEDLDDPGLAPVHRRFIEKLALEGQPLSIKGQIDAFGRLVTERWTRTEHALCKEAGWGYSPKEVPSDIEPSLRVELEQLKRLCFD